MKTGSTVYLDHHSTTPVDPRVLEDMVPYFSELCGNAASRDHEYGAQARVAVDESRQRLASAIGARPEEIVFTSGATEANNLALTGVLAADPSASKHVITSAVEHPAVLDCLRAAESRGIELTILPVDSLGLVGLDDLTDAIRPETKLISIMTANNEVGTLQPIKDIGEIARSRGVLFHTDAAQALGYVELNVKDLKVDLLSSSAHKFYGPKGVGFLYVSRRNPRVPLEPLLYGGGHEGGMRSGTLNVPGIVGMGAACELAIQLMDQEVPRLKSLTDQMLKALEKAVGHVTLHGPSEGRLPHNLNIRFQGVRAKALIVNLPDLAFSTGSACTTAKATPSHVLKAMGLTDEDVRSAVRVGLGRGTTSDDIDFVVNRLATVVERLRGLSSPSA